MSGPIEVAGDQLRTIVERIEKVEEELRELVRGEKEIYQEAESNGFDAEILREVIRVKKTGSKTSAMNKSRCSAERDLQAITATPKAKKAA